MPAGQASALQPDEMRKHIAAIIASALAVSITHTVIAQHSHREHDQEQQQGQAKTQKYTCVMHPEVITDHPGNCPKCGMKLVPVAQKKRPTPNAVKARGAHGALRAQRSTSKSDITRREGTPSHDAGLLPFAGGSQFAVEKFGGGAVGADPIAPAEQVVNFVGKNQLLELDFLGAQFFDQIGGLLKRHVAIIVAMNKEHR